MANVHQIKNTNKETEILRKNQMEIVKLKSMIIEIKNSVEGLNSRSELAKERISKTLEEFSKIQKTGQQRLCKLKKEKKKKEK